MKKYFLGILIFFSVFGQSQIADCEMYEEVIAEIMNSKKFKNTIHYELNDRVPFNFYYSSNCSIVKKDFKITNSKDKKSIIINNFTKDEQNYLLNLFYPLEGMSIQVVLKKRKKFKVCEINVVEL